MGGPSPTYIHVACMEWSTADDNRKSCRGCPDKLTKGDDRIGYLDKSPHCMFVHGKPIDKKANGYWHPGCFEKGLKYFSSTLNILSLRGAPPSGAAAATAPPSKKRKSEEEANTPQKRSPAPKKLKKNGSKARSQRSDRKSK